MRKFMGKLTKPEPKKEGTKATEVARRPVVAKGETSKTKTADDQAAKFVVADLLRPIQRLSEATNALRPQLFIRKLRLCSILFDRHTTDTPDTTRAKDIKRQQLLELVEYLQSKEDLYTQQTIPEIISMVSTNLFRTLSPPVVEVGGGEDAADDEEANADPAWPHLQLVFELFLRVCVSQEVDAASLKRNISGPFVIRFLALFNSEDHRERDYLKTILHRLYAKCMSLRQFIRKSIHNVFYSYIYEDAHHAGIGELLEILGSIINGLALPLKAEHRMFLESLLVPLHKVAGLANFHPQLAYCVNQFVDKDPNLSVGVITGLLKFWPVTDSAKEILFLSELEDILDLTQTEQFSVLIGPLFRRLAKCICSPHFQVAERCLFFWQNEHISELMATNTERIFPILAPALQSKHWHPTVNNLTVDVLKTFIDLDAALVEAHRNPRDNTAQQTRRANMKLQWNSLETQHRGTVQLLLRRESNQKT